MLYWYEAPPPEGEEEAAEQSELEAVCILGSAFDDGDGGGLGERSGAVQADEGPLDGGAYLLAVFAKGGPMMMGHEASQLAYRYYYIAPQ